MGIHESSENYLETILVLNKRSGQVRSIDIANEMDFSRPSVSNAMKKLRENGFINIDEDGFITLTASGKEIAEKIYERHQNLAKFFISIGVKEETAFNDACKIEHVISEDSYRLMMEFFKKNK